MTSAVDPCPEAVKSLRLDQPGWLEASAGTGKTYAIEHLVARILRESPTISLPGILLVTFTEKAAGELREKIRRRLGQEATRTDINAAARLRLQDAWTHFDHASVHTIHGFCLQALRRYAFELGGLFQATLTSEKAIEERALLDLRRQAASGDLPEDLIQDLIGTSLRGNQTKISAFAAKYRPERGDTLEPLPDPEAYLQSTTDIQNHIAALQPLWIQLPQKSLTEQPWFIEFTALFKNRKGPAKYDRRLKALEEMHAHLLAENNCEIWAKLWKKKAGVLAKEAGNLVNTVDLLLPSPELQERLTAISDSLNAFPTLLATWEAQAEREALTPLHGTLKALGEAISTRKREQGLLTYDDMAMQLWQALNNAPALVDLLRRQYPIAIVDEFQDTDPVQWALFERIYLDGPIPRPLYLVGDPKQAIYGFRGGDLGTYLRARRRMQTLSRAHRAMGYSLDSNFRSRSDLLSALNATFAQSDWFSQANQATESQQWKLPADDTHITFTPARYGESKRQQCSDHTPWPQPIVLISPPDHGEKNRTPAAKEDQKEACEQFIASAIAELLKNPDRLLIPDGQGSLRPIHAGDICILLRAHAEKKGLERWFRQLGIPYHVYRQKGLFKSEEAGHLAAILSALAHPLDSERQIAAHLSVLINPDPYGSPISDVLHPLLQALRPLALAGQWPALFRRLLRESGTLDRLRSMPGGLEKLSRYRHLTQRLCREAQSAGLDAIELSEKLWQWRHLQEEEKPDQEGDAVRATTDVPKVTFLTMHSSKGLEFPVVFVAYAKGAPRVGLPQLRHEADLGWTFFLGATDDKKKQALRREALDETRRLFYVAFTRAQFKLFIPLLPPPVGDKELETISPLAGFAHESLLKAKTEHPNLFHHEILTSQFTIEEISGKSNATSEAESDGEDGENGEDEEVIGDDAFETAVSTDLDKVTGEGTEEEDATRFTLQLGIRRRRLASYTQLAQRRKRILLDMEGRRLEPDELEIQTPEIQPSIAFSMLPSIPPTGLSEEKPILPLGAKTGNLLHACLEDLDFTWAKTAGDHLTFAAGPAKAVIEKHLGLHGFAMDLVPEVSRLLFVTLTTPLPDPAGAAAFSLAEVTEKLPELEFMLPYGGGTEIPEVRRAGGYLWGYIDLVFRYRNMVYIIDWKSNFLLDYSPQALQLSMAEEAYDLQGRLYAVAVHRWLLSRWSGYTAEANFGGVYYLYLRGLGGEGHAGIASWRPDSQELETQYPAYLAENLGVATVALQAWPLSPGSNHA